MQPLSGSKFDSLDIEHFMIFLFEVEIEKGMIDVWCYDVQDDTAPVSGRSDSLLLSRQ
jgi:hypothetical protein